MKLERLLGEGVETTDAPNSQNTDYGVTADIYKVVPELADVLTVTGVTKG